MCKVYEDYEKDECNLPSLRESLRSTKVNVVVWDTTLIFH